MSSICYAAAAAPDGDDRNDDLNESDREEQEHEHQDLLAQQAAQDSHLDKEEESRSSDDKDNNICNNNNHNDGIIPKRNSDYEGREYWEERFSVEREYEWLLSFQQLRGQLLPLVSLLAPSSSSPSSPPPEQQPEGPRILVVGCGNSPFSSDLYDAGFRRIVNIDYSETVIENMAQKNAVSRPEMQWLVMDMTDLSPLLLGKSFDLVLDKAAMDTLLTHEGDVWNPNARSVSAARSMCRHISRLLRPGGRFVQVSLVQPHFRKKYLLGLHDPPASDAFLGGNGVESKGEGDEEVDGLLYSKAFGWTLRIENAGEQPRDDSSTSSATSSFGYYWYEMTKH